MSIKDLLGSEILVGDLLSIKQEHIVGVCARVEDGTIAKGVSVSGQPKGEVLPEHLIVKIEFTTVIPAIGGVANVLKLSKPHEKKELIN